MEIVEAPRAIYASDELWLSQPGIATSLESIPNRAGVWWDGKWYVIGMTTSRDDLPDEPDEIGFLLTPKEFRLRKSGHQFTYRETRTQVERAMRVYPKRHLLADL